MSRKGKTSEKKKDRGTLSPLILNHISRALCLIIWAMWDGHISMDRFTMAKTWWITIDYFAASGRGWTPGDMIESPWKCFRTKNAEIAISETFPKWHLLDQHFVIELFWRKENIPICKIVFSTLRPIGMFLSVLPTNGRMAFSWWRVPASSAPRRMLRGSRSLRWCNGIIVGRTLRNIPMVLTCD